MKILSTVTVKFYTAPNMEEKVFDWVDGVGKKINSLSNKSAGDFSNIFRSRYYRATRDADSKAVFNFNMGLSRIALVTVRGLPTLTRDERRNVGNFIKKVAALTKENAATISSPVTFVSEF